MSKIKSVVAAALSLAVIGTAAQAAVITTQTVGDITVTITSQGAPSNNSFGESATGYTAYDVALSTTDGSKFTSAATTFSGPLLQESDYTTAVVRGVAHTTYTGTPDKNPVAGAGNNGGADGQDYSLDSHFLYDVTSTNAQANELFITQPTEDNPAQTGVPSSQANGSPKDDGADVYGIGSNLAINIGWKSALQFSSQDVARLLIPDGQSVTYNFNATTTTNVGGSVLTGTIPGTVATPEPASLSLLGLGGVALLARRKSASSSK